MMLEVTVGCMSNEPTESAGRRHVLQSLVHLAIQESVAAAEEPNVPLTRPMAADELPITIEVVKLNPIGIVLWCADHCRDLGNQIIRRPLIGVQRKDPLVACVVDSSIALCGNRPSLVMQDGGAMLRGDTCGLVRRSAIDDEDLVGPFDTRQHIGDLMRFVSRWDDDR